MPSEQTFYDGSNFFEPLSETVGVGVDKVNFVLCIFSALPLSFIYKTFFPAGNVSKQVRTLVPLLIGFLFCFFCFGRAVKHLLANCLISYALMYLTPPKHVHKVVFAFSMGYLLWIHFYRWLLLTAYYLDVTGPIMVAVQKITLLAFSIHDGKGRKKEDLNESQRKEAVTEIPSLLDYMSYIFNFQTVLTGPANTYSDWAAFVNGTHLQKDKDGKLPSSTGVALRKFAESLIYLYLVVFYVSVYVPEVIAKEEYLALPMWRWAVWWFIVIFFIRVNYYFAWTFADSICNMSGFGFSGYDKDGKAQWNLCTNVMPIQVEMAQSFKETLDGWNIQTGNWLRKAAYERAPKSVRTIATYFLSAVWHGFSVGYFITFGTCALMTLAGATFRRCMRWRFVNNKTHKAVYDFVTFMATKVALAYATYAFVTMHLYPGFDVYKRVFFCVHILGLLILYVLPNFFRPLKKPTTTTTENGNGVANGKKNGKAQ